MMADTKRKVPNLRFKGFTNDWEQRKLKEMLQERNERITANDEYPLMSFVQGVGVAPKSQRYNREFLVKSSNKKYKKTELGDFIYSSNNLETGSIGFNKTGKAVISPVYSIFKSKNNKESQFIGILSKQKRFVNKMLRYRQGVVYGQWKIHESDFLNLQILAPNIQEQEKIIGLFSKLNFLISLQQRKLDLLKQLKKGLLQKMFADKGSKRPILRFNGFTDDWEYRKLKNFSKIFIGLVTTMTKHYSSKGTFLIRNSNISENHISHQDPIFLDKDFAEENKNRKFRINDVVTVHTGDIGTSAVISEAEEGAIGFATIATRLNTNYLYPLFVSDYLNTDAHKAWARRMSTGDGRNNYNLADFKRIIIPSPQEIKEQEIIANIIAKIEIEIFCCQKGLRSLKQLKQGLLQQMFI